MAWLFGCSLMKNCWGDCHHSAPNCSWAQIDVGPRDKKKLVKFVCFNLCCSDCSFPVKWSSYSKKIQLTHLHSYVYMATFSAETEKFLCFFTVLTWRQCESGLQSNRFAIMIENPVASMPDNLTNAGQNCTSTHCWRSDNKPSTVNSPHFSVVGRSCCCFSLERALPLSERVSYVQVASQFLLKIAFPVYRDKNIFKNVWGFRHSGEPFSCKWKAHIQPNLVVSIVV